jgi:hypothetical protein
MSAYDYPAYVDHPTMIAMCRQCTRPDCPDGICAAWRAKCRQVIRDAQAGKRDYVDSGNLRKKYIVYKGEEHCLSEWAEMYGIKATLLYERLKAGWPMERALHAPKRDTSPRYYTLNGETLRTKEWAKRLGVTKECIERRLYQGWPLEKALTYEKGRSLDE